MRSELRSSEASLPVVAEIQASWERSKGAGVSQALAAAPLVLDEHGLFAAREKTDWLSVAEMVLRSQIELVQESGHVLTLFDAHGHMLYSAGDPHVLETVNDIHFIPGADWSEATAGTNGPGTALATDAPAHVIGAQHFSEAFHAWHCAAVPIHGPQRDLLGALDLSGPSQRAEPRILQMARMLGFTVEQALLARAFRRQTVVLAKYAELTARYPLDALLALDADGAVLQATGAARARGLPIRFKVPVGVSGVGTPPTSAPWLAGASVYPVMEEGTRVGACLVQREGKRTLRRAHAAPSSTRYHFEDLIGAGVQDAVHFARAAASTSMPVLLEGESGVGKEVLAQAIHAESARRDGPFIAVNCAALSRELVESELFGYVGGAFSGARTEGAAGKFEAANGGTLFLDEVGELPLPAQAALLRALQEGVVTPVGSSQERRVDVRIISATNRGLDDAVKNGTFRLDVLHRLNVISVVIPPLRTRLDDLAALVQHLGAKIEAETGLPVRLGADVREALLHHAWPGNVRELENVLRRMAVLGREREVTVADLPFTPKSATVAGAVDVQVQRLLEVIHSARNMAEAAARLGINRSTLYRQLERLGLKPRRTATPE